MPARYSHRFRVLITPPHDRSACAVLELTARRRPGGQCRGVLPFVLSVAAVVACGSPRPSVAPAPASAERRAPRESAESLERLEQSVLEVESASSPLAGRSLGGVVRAFSLSLEPLSHAGRLRLEPIASRLAGAPVRSLAQGGLLKEALQVLLDALVPLRPTPGTEREYRDALRRLGETRAQLDDFLLLDDQKPRLEEALHAGANALFMARGAEPPFPVVAPSERAEIPLAPFSEQLARARRDVADVAGIPLMGSRPESARALASIADMMEAADTQRRLTRQVDEVRFQAKRLERASDASRGSAGWIRAGLQAAVDALSLVNGGKRSDWIDEAQRAVAAIDQTSASSFQRAAIQDALRATVDAFAALSPSPPREQPSP